MVWDDSCAMNDINIDVGGKFWMIYLNDIMGTFFNKCLNSYATIKI